MFLILFKYFSNNNNNNNSMYSVLFHLCGITILEIYFFFYYIGPIETTMFKSKLEDLMNKSLNEVGDVRDSLSIIEKQTLQIIYDGYDYSSSAGEKYLLVKSQEGEVRRSEYNDYLFATTIQIWGIFVALSIVSYFIYRAYIVCYNNKTNTNTNTIIQYHSCSDLELNKMEENVAYRKSSIDYDDEEEELENKKLESYVSWKKNKKILNYLFFAGSLILFQYFFFQCVIFNYKPLSLDETRYILFTIFKPFFESMNSGGETPSLPPSLTISPTIIVPPFPKTQ